MPGYYQSYLKTRFDLNSPLTVSPAGTETVCPQSATKDGQDDAVITLSDKTNQSPKLKRSVSWASDHEGSPTTSVVLFPHPSAYEPYPASPPTLSEPTIPRRRSSSTPSATNKKVVPAPSPILRRPITSSPPLPPSRIASEPDPVIRRQGSGAELSPIFECRLAECDGAKKKREEKERAALLSRDGDGKSEEREKENRIPTPGFEFIPAEGKKGESIKGRMSVESDFHANTNANTTKPETGPGLDAERGTTATRPGTFRDPFTAAMTLLILPFLPPVAVHLTLQETGERYKKGYKRKMATAVALTLCAWVPGVIYALLVYIRHLPSPANEESKPKPEREGTIKDKKEKRSRYRKKDKKTDGVADKEATPQAEGTGSGEEASEAGNRPENDTEATVSREATDMEVAEVGSMDTGLYESEATESPALGRRLSAPS
ncbi:hypothetical protein DL546_004302 [Coniochaeta pulveracea]|uniref:Uncharacterized protein n=1 Tax=Coniochaeta pulveracea TaxID=177199 RepID=A0A420YKT2_9PEZI|nr:hypothetical protein DL546_004302 [Coniochaeta pulveracea]